MLPFRFSAKTIIDEGRTNRESIEVIKNWLRSTSLPQLQEEFIVLFLLSNANNIEDTKTTIKSYFKIKNNAPHIYNDYKLESEEIKKARKVLGIYIVPHRINNTVVVCARVLDTNYRNFEIIPVIKYACMSLFASQIDNPPSDMIVVFDLQGIGFMHLTRLKIGVVATHLRMIQEGLPIKIRQIHILNCNYIFDRVISLFRTFIKNELLDAFKTHRSGLNWTEFHEKWIPACCLPEEYGGKLESYVGLIYKTDDDIKNCQDFFDAEEELWKSYKP